MSDLSKKSSGELAEELQNLMPKLISSARGWRIFLGHPPTAEVAIHMAQLVLTQQKEIEQLKAEMKELKK